eukprot:5088632-Pyramimonas_sp.AAC.1
MARNFSKGKPGLRPEPKGQASEAPLVLASLSVQARLKAQEEVWKQAWQASYEPPVLRGPTGPPVAVPGLASVEHIRA